MLIGDPPPAFCAVATGVATVGELVVVNEVDGVGLTGWSPPAAGLPLQSPLNQLCNVPRSDCEHVGQTLTGLEERGVKKADWQKHDV